MYIVQLVAASVVGQVLAGKNLNQALSEALKKNADFSPQERGALQDICYGTLRFYGLLIKIQNVLLNKPLQDSRLKDLLLVALFQLQYSKAAKYAVVDNAVRAAKQINGATGGLINAVLRNYLRKQTDLLQLANEDEEGRYSYPQWWIDTIKNQYHDRASAILNAGNQHPPMTLRVNQRIMSSEKYLEQLAAQNMEAQIILTRAILLNSPVMVDKLP